MGVMLVSGVKGLSLSDIRSSCLQPKVLAGYATSHVRVEGYHS